MPLPRGILLQCGLHFQTPVHPDVTSPVDLGRSPYVLYGVKYIDLVSLAQAKQARIQTSLPV